LFFVTGVSAFASYKYFSEKKHLTKNKETDSPVQLDLLFPDPETLEDDDKNLSVLILGFGGAGHQGGYLADVIQLARFDFEKNKIFLISIPRDLNITLEDGNTRKINSILSYGMTGDNPLKNGGELSQKYISAVTGLPIKYFTAVDFNGFKRAIGYELNNIQVQVAQTFDDPWYPIEGKQLDPCGHSPEEIAEMTNTLSGFELEKQFACRYEHIHYEAGTVTMEGGDALAYVRSRHSTSDFDRSRRQAEVLTAMRDKLFSLKALNNIPGYYKSFTKHISTNFDLETLEYLAPLFVNAKEMEVVSINLSTANVLTNSNNGSYGLVPQSGANNWSGIHNYIQSEINK
jgi:anionic cell wall polymer biosynthesis LytR-Cps2A-Psr (LCP) family protein